MYFWLLKFFVCLHNLSYKIIGNLAIKLNGGQHPKHVITDYHQFFVNNLQQNESVLDIGCGDGNLAFDLAKKVKHVVGIDLDSGKIKKAKQKYGAKNIEYRVADATQNLGKESFDAVILSNVLEHIEDRVSFLRNISQIAPKALIRVPLLDRDWLTVYKKENGLEYRLDPTHFIEYTIPLLQEELEQGGWKMEKHSVQFGELWGLAVSKN